ncbi:hypothetical protein QVD17_28460 [Tagetes erecta]|uniref:Uncharacterized protein n=1 Tax=Tagetes erecta TaxID=13708 RepID=A0AAD8NKH2_TARER|nr:hypothetical protein QVD17_28460 [Tagetes erecta]
MDLQMIDDDVTGGGHDGLAKACCAIEVAVVVDERWCGVVVELGGCRWWSWFKWRRWFLMSVEGGSPAMTGVLRYGRCLMISWFGVVV